MLNNYSINFFDPFIRAEKPTSPDWRIIKLGAERAFFIIY